MIIQSRIQRRGLQKAVGSWSLAVLCGSIAVACSGTIETPTDEFPPRRTSSTAAANADDDDDNTPAPPASSAGANDEEDEVESQDPPAGSDEDPPGDDGSGDDDSEADPPAGGGGDLSFAADVQPIFNSQCGSCHVTDGIVHNIGSEDLDEAFADAVEYEDAVIAELEAGTMPIGCGAPPGGGGSCISEEDFQTIVDWYEAGAPE